MTHAERLALLQMPDEELWSLCESDFRRGTGNGGQKLNKTSSTVRIFHAETGITVNCMESRSQSVNRRIALKKLRLRIASRVRCAPAGMFKPDPAPSVENQHYPEWIASLFDRIAVAGWDLKAAAQDMGTSRSRLTRLIQRDPSLWREYITASKSESETEI